MIVLHTPRTDVETILRYLFVTINLYKRTRLENVKYMDVQSEEYLSAVVINCILDEVELVMQKKLINTVSKKTKIKFTEAQAAVLYKSLMALPIGSENVYFQILRNQWVERLDQQLITTGFYKNAAKPHFNGV
jgi:hypothetical protein